MTDGLGGEGPTHGGTKQRKDQRTDRRTEKWLLESRNSRLKDEDEFHDTSVVNLQGSVTYHFATVRLQCHFATVRPGL